MKITLNADETVCITDARGVVHYSEEKTAAAEDAAALSIPALALPDGIKTVIYDDEEGKCFGFTTGAYDQVAIDPPPGITEHLQRATELKATAETRRSLANDKPGTGVGSAAAG